MATAEFVSTAGCPTSEFDDWSEFHVFVDDQDATSWAFGKYMPKGNPTGAIRVSTPRLAAPAALTIPTTVPQYFSYQLNNVPGSAGFGALSLVGSTGTAQVWTLTEFGAGLGGTFTLTYGGQVTSALNAASATAAQIQSALQALSTVGTGNMTVSGTTFTNAGGTMTITAAGTLAGQALGQITIQTGSITGTLNVAVVGVTTNGSAAVALNANSVEVAKITLPANSINLVTSLPAASSEF